MKTGILFAAALAACAFTSTLPVRAESQGVLVTVNDRPITSFDVQQRIQLNAILGRGQGSVAEQRKRALQNLIDDQVKLAEAKKLGATPDDKMINAQIDKMAKGSNTDAKGLAAQLKSKGSSISALRTLVTAQISFNRLISSLYKVKVEVDPAEIDRKYNEFANDPRLQPITVYEIMEIEMPVENTGEAMAQQLLVARAADAAQYRSKFKGCASARQAAGGIFNVQIGKRMQADGRKLPKPLKAALDKAGTGGLIGPARSRSGIQLIAFCGKKNIAPDKPTRQQVEMMLSNKKYDVYEERYMRELRRNAFIEYKDAKAPEDAKATE
ncbi:SurA N-terminal domain-containing protein [Taklimakanibacter deserti]|uniref:SurA N-terminal domain-containing protein n=1 Tax=Taklimakanibacter deserti TaxID=2267839 RepID=UPI000E64CFF7